MPGVRSRIAFGSIEAQRDGINALAADTGGKAIFNNNDINLGFQKILDDTDTYYLLAFEPPVSYRDGRFRKIEVKLPGHPKYRVRTRKGYFAPDEKQLARAEREQSRLIEAALTSPKEATKLRDLQIRNALSTLTRFAIFHLASPAGYIETREEGQMIDLPAHIDVNGIRLQTAGNDNRHGLN
jgi:hypothetical protein